MVEWWWWWSGGVVEWWNGGVEKWGCGVVQWWGDLGGVVVLVGRRWWLSRTPPKALTTTTIARAATTTTTVIPTYLPHLLNNSIHFQPPNHAHTHNHSYIHTYKKGGDKIGVHFSVPFFFSQKHVCCILTLINMCALTDNSNPAHTHSAIPHTSHGKFHEV